jgi:hypothetical protein
MKYLINTKDKTITLLDSGDNLTDVKGLLETFKDYTLTPNIDNTENKTTIKPKKIHPVSYREGYIDGIQSVVGN